MKILQPEYLLVEFLAESPGLAGGLGGALLLNFFLEKLHRSFTVGWYQVCSGLPALSLLVPWDPISAITSCPLTSLTGKEISCLTQI